MDSLSDDILASTRTPIATPSGSLSHVTSALASSIQQLQEAEGCKAALRTELLRLHMEAQNARERLIYMGSQLLEAQQQRDVLALQLEQLRGPVLDGSDLIPPVRILVPLTVTRAGVEPCERGH